MILFQLEPRAALHVGEFVGIERESVQGYIPSDTLFAACVVAWQQRGDDIAARINACQASPPALLLTSAFPRAGDILLYPMPLGVRLDTPVQALEPKQRKRIRWVSRSLFERLTQFQNVKDECAPDKNFVQAGSVWLTQAEVAQLRKQLGQPAGDLRLWDTQIVPRVTVDRADNKSNLYHVGRLNFAAGCGLWFMAQGSGADWVRDALAMLQDSGIGGLRSIGHGAFTATGQTAPDMVQPAQGYAITLSRSAFQIVTVGGWCQDDAGKAWRRKSVRMLAEGACVGAAARGHIPDVMPDIWKTTAVRPVVRYGMAFKTPVREEALIGDEQ
jgi:CRISPR-associated protein Csm4